LLDEGQSLVSTSNAMTAMDGVGVVVAKEMVTEDAVVGGKAMDDEDIRSEEIREGAAPDVRSDPASKLAFGCTSARGYEYRLTNTPAMEPTAATNTTMTVERPTIVQKIAGRRPQMWRGFGSFGVAMWLVLILCVSDSTIKPEMSSFKCCG